MRMKDSLLRTTTETSIFLKFSFNCTDPAPTQYPQGGKINIGDLPVFYVATNFIVQNISSRNGPIRQIPMTQNNQRPIPTLSDEPLWMKRSTICPAQEGMGALSPSFMAIFFSLGGGQIKARHPPIDITRQYRPRPAPPLPPYHGRADPPTQT